MGFLKTRKKRQNSKPMLTLQHKEETMSEIIFWILLAGVMLPIAALSLALVYAAMLIIWVKRKTEAATKTNTLEIGHATTF